MFGVQFIPPAPPGLRASPPIGDGWQHEVKFDGYRVQLHKAGLSSDMYGKNGGDFTRRSRDGWLGGAASDPIGSANIAVPAKTSDTSDLQLLKLVAVRMQDLPVDPEDSDRRS